MIWGPRPKLGIAPPMGREIPTIHILAYNFWTVSQKIKISVSVDSLCRAESENVNYARIDWTPCRPFWNLSYIFISSEPFDISSQKSVGIINIMSWTYHRSMKTAPPTVREILRSMKKTLNFWNFCLKFVLLTSFCSLGYADSENVSFVIFQNSVCPPYWSKWTTVFSLLLLENLSNSSQNCLRWSLDWAEQNLLNIIFWPLVKKKVMMFWTTTSTQNWFGGCNLSQTLINRNETWYASSKPRSEGKYQSWEQRHLWVLR